MTTGFLFADEMDLAGRRVLLRLDVNVPIQDGQVSDDTRIRRIVPGLRALVAARAKIIILTHFGRPKGKFEPDLSIRPVANCMTKLLGQARITENQSCLYRRTPLSESEFAHGPKNVDTNQHLYSGNLENVPNTFPFHKPPQADVSANLNRVQKATP